jgi:D-glycero-D-manno-heptose 1,7-bisphosphate phosphatase
MIVRPGQPPQRRFVVIDRDGTVIEEREYLSEPEQVKLIPGAPAARRELPADGIRVGGNHQSVGRRTRVF